MNLLQEAQAAITAATEGDRLNRVAVMDWLALRNQASGEEAELIGESAEALIVATSNARDQQWLLALLSGDPMAAAMQNDDAFAFAPERGLRSVGQGMSILDEVGPVPVRRDAADEPEAGGLDWGLIARETQEMIRLNEGSSEGTKPEEA